MTTYRLVFSHYDETSSTRYNLLDITNSKILLNSVPYREGYQWCVENIADDDMYQEECKGDIYCNQTGSKLRSSYEKIRAADAGR